MSEKLKQPENEFLSSLKVVNPNFVIIEVLKKHKSILMIEATEATDYEEFLPILAVGANVKDYKPGDMVYLSHYGRYPMFNTLGKDYIYCNYMDIVFSSTKEYANSHKTYVKPTIVTPNLAQISKIRREDDLIN